MSLTLLASCGNFQFPSFGGGGPSHEGPTVDLSKPVKVALLVPNGGNDAGLNAIGDSLANAGQIAMSHLNRGEIDLKVYSTGGSPQRAAQLAKQAEEEGVSLIVGPLKSEEELQIEGVTTLPIISFSNNQEIAEGRAYTLGTTFVNIANRVIDFQKSRGGETIGVVFPNNIGGQQGASATAAAANELGVKVVAQGPYNLGRADITSAAPAIADKLRSSAANMVMFTDNPAGGLSYIAVALRDNGYTSSDAQYLGLARWDDEPARLADAGLDGGIFAAPDMVTTSSFNNLYASTYGSTPHALAGLGYDGIATAIQLVRRARSSNDDKPFGSDDIDGFSLKGANGAIRFQNNMAQRALSVMQLNGGRAVIVSPAPGRM